MQLSQKLRKFPKFSENLYGSFFTTVSSHFGTVGARLQPKSRRFRSSLPVTPRFTQSSDVVADLRFRLKIHFLLVACVDLKCVTVASFTFFLPLWISRWFLRRNWVRIFVDKGCKYILGLVDNVHVQSPTLLQCWTLESLGHICFMMSVEPALSQAFLASLDSNPFTQ